MPNPNLESIRRAYHEAIRAMAHAATARTQSQLRQTITAQRVRQSSQLISGSRRGHQVPSPPLPTQR